MSPTWISETPPDRIRITPGGWLRVILRGVPLACLVFGGLAVHLALRIIERPVAGLHRPVTPFITQFVCRNALRLIGVQFDTQGALMTQPGAVVANHSSWLDIFALNARKRIYFVSKAEVASWPGIGWLARATGTVFIERNPARAREQARLFEGRLRAGHKLVFFPEGTSTDGLRVLPFKTSLFAAFFSKDLHKDVHIQPVCVTYCAPSGAPSRFYGWWGDMAFGPHLVQVLASRHQGCVALHYLEPVAVRDYQDRKTLAAELEKRVRQAHERAFV